MLSMLLLLAAAPQVQTGPLTLPEANIEQMIAAGVAPPPVYPRVQGVIGLTPAHCSNRVIQASDPAVPGSNLLWRDGSQRVALYRLLDRYVDGCPAPLIVNYRVGGSNAVGREMGRDPAPPNQAIPRP